jgi:hypothetical protein
MAMSRIFSLSGQIVRIDRTKRVQEEVIIRKPFAKLKEVIHESDSYCSKILAMKAFPQPWDAGAPSFLIV